MRNLNDLKTALVNAHAAGDTQAATMLANEISRMSAAAGVGEQFDPTSGMSFTEKLLAGVGKAFVDTGRGVKQIVGLRSREEVDRDKELDAPLMKTGAGLTGNILGNAAMFAPVAFVPGANTYTGAALAGSVAGASQPVGTDESRLTNAAIGGGAGVAGQALGNTLGRAIKPVASRLSPEKFALATAASREGIPLSAADLTGSRPLKIAESVMENLPLTAGSQLARSDAKQRAFTSAALSRAGIQGDSAGSAVLGTAKDALGKQMGAIASQNAIDMAPVLPKLANIVDDASKHLPPDAAAKVATAADQILSQTKNGILSGDNYQGWREPLRAMAKKGDETARYFSQMRGLLDTEFKAQLTGADAALFSDASRKYANLKTIAQAMGGAGNLPAQGQISPSQLAAALSGSVGREGKALGRGDLNELTRIGQLFVKDQIPNSGTAQRQLMQSLLTTGSGSLIGGGASVATGGDLPSGMLAGATLGAAGLGTPKLVQALMNSKAGQAYLSKGVVNLTAAQRKALATALRTGAVSSTLPLLPAYE